jgi:hypothetical protein
MTDLYDAMAGYYRLPNQIVWKNKKMLRIRWLELDLAAVRVFPFLFANVM